MYIQGAAPKIKNCWIFGNYGGSGGGIFSDSAATPLIENCHIFDNRTHYDSGGGGGIKYEGRPIIRNCVIEFNWGGSPGFGGVGGGIAGDGRALIENCIIRHNLAGDAAGGLRLIGIPRVVDCLVFDNHAGNYGGAVAFVSGYTWNPVMEGCTLVGNSAAAGSAIFHANRFNGVPPGVLGIYDSIIAFNSGGAAIACTDDGWPIKIGCTDIFGNEGGDWVEGYAYLQDREGNLGEDPLFCDLTSWDLSLNDISPCLPQNNDCGVQMGAMGQGCLATPVNPWQDSTDTVLEPAFPNPFNPRTVLAFRLAEPGWASLTIHDLEGRRVARLAEGEFPAGRRSFVWEGRDDVGRRLASGVYFARLLTSEGARSQKLLMLK